MSCSTATVSAGTSSFGVTVGMSADMIAFAYGNISLFGSIATEAMSTSQMVSSSLIIIGYAMVKHGGSGVPPISRVSQGPFC